MDDLITWLKAALDDDERDAQTATPGPWVTNGTAVWRKPDDSWDFRRAMDGRHGRMPYVMVDPGETPEPLNAEHIARWDPARVLALMTALRTLLDEFHGEARETVAIMTIGHALYAERPGYLPEWRP
jgi:hypothetical protein